MFTYLLVRGAFPWEYQGKVSEKGGLQRVVRCISVLGVLQRMGLFSLLDWNVWAECYIAAFDIIVRIG